MPEETPPVIDVQELHASYGKGPKRKEALKGISFTVHSGECVGFIGGNGAGKSTTMKHLLGFRFPDQGQVTLFGQPAGSVESRNRLGYLPEVSLYYPFMKARELLEFYGGLSGLSKQTLQERMGPLLKQVGLEGKGEFLLKHFSKGMQQRLGIAQSLIAEPDLLIYDELASGLDPIGRHDLREILMDLKGQGKTVFFSSHELGEVERLCDRVILIHEGRIIRDAPLQDLLEECGDRSLETFFIETIREEATA